METRNPCSWSELPHDVLESIFKRLSFTDFHRAKIVCSNWSSSSKLTVPSKVKSPWLMLFPEGYQDGCVQLYNPEEDRIYKTKRDFSGIRFLGNWGNWFLVIDSRSNLYIIDVFSENRINLLPLESLLDDEESEDDLSGLLWVDENIKEYVVVLFFNFPSGNVTFARKVESVNHIFKRHPDIALGFRRAYMNELFSLIEMLCQSPEKLSEDDLRIADETRVDLIDVGFKVDLLKKKLNEVSEKKKIEQNSKARLQTIEAQLQKLKLMFLDLDSQLQKEKAVVLAARAPHSFNDVVC